MKASVTVHEIALVQMQGGTVGATIEYPAISNKRNADRVATRDLRALATPLVSCTIYCGQEAANLDIGSVFKLEWPEYHDGTIIMRVTGMAFGDGKTDRIRLECVQDVFGAPQDSMVNTGPPGLWDSPSRPPDGVLTLMVSEVPYWILVREVGSLLIDDFMAQDPDVGFFVAAGEQPRRATSATIRVNDEDVGVTGFTPTGMIDESVGYLDTAIRLRLSSNLSRVRVGSFAQMGEELVRVDAITGSVLTVGRGVLDTVPQPHSPGTMIFFWQDFARGDEEQYTAAESIDVRLVARNNSGTGPASAAQTVEFDSRAIRPLPPGNVKVNGIAYPEETFTEGELITITWSHRDRLSQTGGTFIDTTSGNVGPETGTTYNLQIRDSDDVLVVDETGISGTSWTETDEFADADTYTVRLWSVRNGYESWQAHEFDFVKLGLGLNSPVNFDCPSDLPGLDDPIEMTCEET
jgi:hypothetical protein